MQIRTAERIAVWRACVCAAGYSRSTDEKQERKAAALPQTGATGEARGKRTRGRRASRGVAVSACSHPMHESRAVLEKREGGVATLILNRPERMNALNKDLVLALNDALTRVEADEEINVVVLAGAGRAFCAGGDLAAIGKGRQENNTAELQPILRSGMQAVLKIRTMRQPVIAAVHGAAAGAGMNIALAADIRIASEDAMFGQNFAKMGLFPDYGGTFFFPQLVGAAETAGMFFTRGMINAAGGPRLGVVDIVVPPGPPAKKRRARGQKKTPGAAI